MNKFLFISLFLFGCAHGVVDEPLDIEVNQKINTPTPPKQITPPEEGQHDKPSKGKDCWVAQTVYADNCVLKVIKCTDGTIDFDSYCYGPPYVPPWEWWHDPVGPLRDNKQ